MRKPLAIAGSCALFLLVGWLLNSGNINLADFLTQLAVGLSLMALGLLYWGFRPEINRAVRERGRPKFHVLPLIQRPNEQMREIRVRLGPEQFRTRDARFALASVKNLADVTAEEVVPLVGVPETWGALRSLVWIMPTGKPWLTVNWVGTVGEFEHDPDGFATAIIHDENTQKSVSLYGKGLASGLVLFFTLKDSPVVYFPSTGHDAIVMPCKFHIVLYFQAKDLPLYRAKTYAVSASSWDSLQLNEVAEKKHSRLRSIFSHEPRNPPIG